MKKNLFILFLSVGFSCLCAFLVSKYYLSHNNSNPDSVSIYNSEGTASAFPAGVLPDFTYAAENSVDGVVHVKVLKRERVRRQASILDYFFGYGAPYSQERRSINSGSGVIVSPDGYIVTNNHVVEGAAEILVTLNDNKSFAAKMVGTDPVTDIALLKVTTSEMLPVIPLGDSDSLRLGEWVLAIGNPFNLRSTITAGIVSAKGRSLPDGSGNYKVESFIQTDAAVNPGNSGGALVNTKGELVGINTAIASNTGSYTGYSFAVPVTIVKKVISDLQKFGQVQRAMLGISMAEMTDNLARTAGIAGNYSGVYIADVVMGGAAHDADVRAGDVLVAINDVAVVNPSGVQEKINMYRPGDEVKLDIVRMGESKEIIVKLKGR